MNKEIEQEALEESNNVYGTSTNNFGAQRDGFVKGYIAGSTARSYEDKESNLLLARAQRLMDELEYPKETCFVWAELYDDINNFFKTNP